jgi:hypothetical protein
VIKNNNIKPLIHCIIKNQHEGGGRFPLKRILAHSGIKGKEETDQEAKNATTLLVDKLLLTSVYAVAQIKNNISKPHEQQQVT